MFWTRRLLPATECALLVAIPLDRDEFTADAGRPTDFVRAYSALARQYGQDPWAAYEAHATLCRGVAAEVARRGVAVMRRATLTMMADAMARFRVVTLVAHARGPEIEAYDLADPQAIRAKRGEIAQALGLPCEPAPGSDDVEHLTKWLDAALGPLDDEDVEHAAGVAETTAYARRVALQQGRWDRRRLVETACPGALAGGPAIELCEGLAGIEQVNAALPRQFHVLDLTVCDSVLLAERLRADRPDGLILANPRPTTPDFRLVLYREVVGLMARHRVSYPDAVIQLRRHLRKQTCPQ